MKYTIPRRKAKCSGNQDNFEEGTTIISFLVPQKEYVYERYDYCLHCWETSGSKLAEKEEVSSWKTILPSKKTLPPVPLDLQLFDLFRELYRPQEQLEEIYLLALYLERKKILIKRGTKKEIQFFEHPESGEMFSVQSATLTDDPDKTLSSLLSQMQN